MNCWHSGGGKKKSQESTDQTKRRGGGKEEEGVKQGFKALFCCILEKDWCITNYIYKGYLST